MRSIDDSDSRIVEPVLTSWYPMQIQHNLWDEFKQVRVDTGLTLSCRVCAQTTASLR